MTASGTRAGNGATGAQCFTPAGRAQQLDPIWFRSASYSAPLSKFLNHAVIGCNGAMAYSHASRDNGRSVDERMDAQRASVVDITSRTKPSQTR